MRLRKNVSMLFNLITQLLTKLRSLPAEEFGVGIYTQVKDAHIELGRMFQKKNVYDK